MRFILFVYFILILASAARAEWAKDSDADIELNEANNTIEVNADGTYRMEEQRTFTALNDKGRAALAREAVPFFPDFQEVKIKSAVSITGGVVTKVDPLTIQQQVKKAEDGVNEANEWIIPFPGLKVGSSVKYEVSTVVKKCFPGSFSMRFIYGLTRPQRSGKVIIRSPKKILYAFMDPNKALDIQSSKEGTVYKLTITLTKSAFKSPQETSPVLPKKLYAQVEVSTAQDWGTYARPVAEKYEQILAAPLPPVLKAISQKASNLKDPSEKIDKVTSELASLFAYSGNWTTIDKRLFPKNLEEISTHKTADCLDFAMAAVAVLRDLGLKADVSLVYRQGSDRILGPIYMNPIDSKIPMTDIFNHAIVHVETEQKDFWVDPTNAVSNSKYIFSAFAGSPALELNKETKELTSIPESTPLDNGYAMQKTVTIHPNHTVDTDGSFDAFGDYAKGFLENGLYNGEQVGKDQLLTFYGSTPTKTQSFIDGVSFKSRGLQNLTAKIKTVGEKSTVVEQNGATSLFAALPLRLKDFTTAGGKRVSDFYVGTRGQETAVIKVPGFDFGEKDWGCVALTPWFTVERKLLKTQEGFEIRDTVHYLRSVIKAEEVNQEKFAFALSDLQSCTEAQYIDIHPLAKDQSLEQRTQIDFKDLEKTLNASGSESAGKIKSNKNKLDQILASDPTNKDARLLLFSVFAKIYSNRVGFDRLEYTLRAGDIVNQLYSEFPDDEKVLKAKTEYALLKKNPTEAKKFFKLAYYVSGKDRDLYLLGGRLGREMKDYKMAEGSLKKALNLTLEKEAASPIYRQLAEIAEERHRPEESVKYYRKALEMNPDDPRLYSDFIAQLLQMNRWDEAIKLGEKMLTLADFGTGRSLLGHAYSGKASQIWSRSVKIKKGLSSPDREVVTASCLKALKYNGTDYECLIVLGTLALDTAQKENSLEKAQIAFDYATRALGDTEAPDHQTASIMRDQAKAMIARMQRQSAPVPAAAPAPAPENGNPLASHD